MKYLKIAVMALLSIPAVLCMPFLAFLFSLATLQKVYAKWGLCVLVDFALTLTLPIAAPIIAAFTREQPYVDGKVYTWGWLYGTHDNPPQGDAGYVSKRCWFPGHTSGLRGYLNRIGWMFRNPVYGWAKAVAVKFDPLDILITSGNPDISDKYKVPGYYHTEYIDHLTGKLLAFELYVVYPWSDDRDVRIRIGWKMSTEKFASQGFAQMVNTVNLLDGYGNK